MRFMKFSLLSDIKAASTWHHRFKKGLVHFSEKNSPLYQSLVAYSGERLEFSDGVSAVPYNQIAECLFE